MVALDERRRSLTVWLRAHRHAGSVRDAPDGVQRAVLERGVGLRGRGRCGHACPAGPVPVDDQRRGARLRVEDVAVDLSCGEAAAGVHARHAARPREAGKAVAGRRPAMPVPVNGERSRRLVALRDRYVPIPTQDLFEVQSTPVTKFHGSGPSLGLVVDRPPGAERSIPFRSRSRPPTGLSVCPGTAPGVPCQYSAEDRAPSGREARDSRQLAAGPPSDGVLQRARRSRSTPPSAAGSRRPADTCSCRARPRQCRNWWSRTQRRSESCCPTALAGWTVSMRSRFHVEATAEYRGAGRPGATHDDTERLGGAGDTVEGLAGADSPGGPGGAAPRIAERGEGRRPRVVVRVRTGR